jgi:hypothetical protein
MRSYHTSPLIAGPTEQRKGENSFNEKYVHTPKQVNKPQLTGSA